MNLDDILGGLNPCPLCGGGAQKHYECGRVQVICSCCGFYGSPEEECNAVLAVRRWNSIPGRRRYQVASPTLLPSWPERVFSMLPEHGSVLHLELICSSGGRGHDG